MAIESSPEISTGAASVIRGRCQSSTSGRDNSAHQHWHQRSGPGQGLTEASSSKRLQESTGDLLREMDNALKASSDLIGSSWRKEGQDGNNVKEYHHEYHHQQQSYSSNSSGPPKRLGMDEASSYFDLEKQVQHMMPQVSSGGRQLEDVHDSITKNLSHQMQSSMMSSVEQRSSSSFTTYKVQTNQYSSSGERMVSSYDQSSRQQQQQQQQQQLQLPSPASGFKQNIDDLDNLLSDLNNARKMDDSTSASDYNSYHHHHHQEHRSLDNQGHVKRTVRTLDQPWEPELVMTTTPETTQPAPTKIDPPPGPVPPERRPHPHTMRPDEQDASLSNVASTRTTSTTVTSRRATDEGMTLQDSSRFPPSTRPQGPLHGRPNRQQSPPKKVDDLMHELSEFDPFIKQQAPFIEPPTKEEVKVDLDVKDSSYTSDAHRAHQGKPPAVQGPGVYYPPGELFSSVKGPQPQATSPAEIHHKDKEVSVAVSKEGGPAGDRVWTTSSPRAPQKRATQGRDKGRWSEGEGKQGAAVIPICLPLCCAAPCVIL